MQDLITSYIIQSKKCSLGQIGSFRITRAASKTDIVNKKFCSPAPEFIFSSREEKVSEGLVKYVSERRGISLEESQVQLKEWCMQAKSKLKKGEEILFKPLGFLKKSPLGITFFPNKNANPFFEAVPATRVIHKNAEHEMMVGDKETTSAAMKDFYTVEDKQEKARPWRVIAIVLLSIGLLILLFYFYNHSFSLSAIGRQVKMIPSPSPKTYTIQ